MKRTLIKPTAAEDAAINAGIAQDPDTAEISDAQVAAAAAGKRARGRPRSQQPKELVSLRLDADLLQEMRATGQGWQTQVNDLLRREWPRLQQRRTR